MKIKWSFFFTNQERFESEIMNETDDLNLVDRVNSGDEVVFIPGTPREAWVRMENVKVILREPVDEAVIETPVPEVQIEAEPAE